MMETGQVITFGLKLASIPLFGQLFAYKSLHKTKIINLTKIHGKKFGKKIGIFFCIFYVFFFNRNLFLFYGVGMNHI